MHMYTHKLNFKKIRNVCMFQFTVNMIFFSFRATPRSQKLNI